MTQSSSEFPLAFYAAQNMVDHARQEDVATTSGANPRRHAGDIQPKETVPCGMDLDT